MRKATFAIIAGIAIISAVLFITGKNDMEPYKDVLARNINYSTLCECHDTNFNTMIRVPGMFVTEADTSAVAYSYARYAYYPKTCYTDAEGQITIEYCAAVCKDHEQWTEKTDSTARHDGYTVLSKSVRRQKMMFTYSLTYPSAYDTSVDRLKKEVKTWKAFCANPPKKRPVIMGTKRKRAKAYHSGFAVEQQ